VSILALVAQSSWLSSERFGVEPGLGELAAPALRSPLTFITDGLSCTDGVCALGSGNVGANYGQNIAITGGSCGSPCSLPVFTVGVGKLPRELLETKSARAGGHHCAGKAPRSQIATGFVVSESCLHRWLKFAEVEDYHPVTRPTTINGCNCHHSPRGAATRQPRRCPARNIVDATRGRVPIGTRLAGAGDVMRRTERRLFQLNEELARLRRAAELTAGELEMHRHLDDDARRDALVSGAPMERAEARQTAKDVRQMEDALEDLRRHIVSLEAKRTRLLSGLEA